MATFHAYISTDGTDYNLVLSEIDHIDDISGDQSASIRVLGFDGSTAIELEGVFLDLQNTDTYLAGGNIFHLSLTESQYNTILPVTSYTRTEGTDTINYLYENQIELYLGPTFTPTAITNEDTSVYPHLIDRVDSNGFTQKDLVVAHDGLYQVTITDADMLSVVQSIVIDVNDKPNVSLSPAEDFLFDSGDDLVFGLSVADHDGTLASVSFKANGVEVLDSTQMSTLSTSGELMVTVSNVIADTTFELSAVDSDGSTASVSVEAELDQIISTLNFSSLVAGTTLSIISGVDDVSGTGGTISGVLNTAITPIVITGTVASNLEVGGNASLTGAPPGWNISSSTSGNVITMTITGNHPAAPATWGINLEGWNVLTVPTCSDGLASSSAAFSGASTNFSPSYSGDATTYSISASGTQPGQINIFNVTPGQDIGGNASVSESDLAWNGSLTNASIQYSPDSTPASVTLTVSWPATANYAACSDSGTVSY